MVSLRRGLEVYINFYLRRRSPTIVYAMGRVGSWALFRSLYAHGEFALHDHVLHPVNLKLKEGVRPGTSKWAYKEIIRKHKKAQIISLVRNPVECMVSAFAPQVKGRFDTDNGWEHLSTEELSDQFRTGYFEQQRHLQKLNWFDSEFKAALGIDVYKYPFPKDTGYVRIQKGPHDVLIIRTELDDALKAQVVSDFLGLTNLKIIRTRVGEQQPYGEIYKVFKQRVTVPERYLDTIINSRYAQHFFPQDTLDAMRERFSAKGETLAGRGKRMSSLSD